MPGVLAAIDQYRTSGELGVDGLKYMSRYLEVRFEYAGESMKETIDDGNGTTGEVGFTPGSGTRASPIPICSYSRFS